MTKKRTTFLDICGSAADFIFPERCVLCGEFLTYSTRRGPYPLCRCCCAEIEKESLLSVRRCRKCGSALISEEDLCSECRQHEHSFTENISLYRYSGAVKKLVLAYKSGKQKHLSRFFAWAIDLSLKRNSCRGPLVPVPPRPGSVKKRGYDQIECICGELEHRYSYTVARILVRRKGAQEQKTLRREDRFLNLKNAIYCKLNKEEALPVEAVLLDDVFTTGATADACASVLLYNGVRKVHVVTIGKD